MLVAQEPNEAVQRGPRAGGYIQVDPYQKMINRLSAFFAPKRNPTYERHVLRKMKQKEDERIEMFVMRLRCEYGERVDEFLKDQFTEGCLSDELRKKILVRRESTLEELLVMARVEEAVREEQKAFQNDKKSATVISSDEVNKIDAKPKYEKRQPWADRNKNRDITCNRCGRKGHKATDEKCPAKGQKCNNCGGRDHFARRCFSKKRFARDNGSEERSAKQAKTEQSVRFVSSALDDAASEDVLCIRSGETGNVVKCTFGGIETLAIIDSGSKHNLIDESSWKQLKAKGIEVHNKEKGSDVVFRAYGGQTLDVIGRVDATMEVADRVINTKFYVMKGKGKFLIGRDTAIALGILQLGVVNAVDDTVEEFPKIKGVLVDIPIRSDVKPVIQNCRRVPVLLEKAVKEKIQKMCQQGIIEKVHRVGHRRW